MGSPNIRDLLMSFSPSLDFFAICSGDGRIKIWDTLKGQLQTEFADITSTDGTDLYAELPNGHLSLDYTCMKWLPLERKKKRKVGCSLLVLGTGSGDVLALDVSSGQLKWRVSNCHAGGVKAISFSTHISCTYTAGVDGMVCQIEYTTGILLRKYKSSTKAISSMAISSDGTMLATAAGQLKICSCSDNEKIQKFSGHPGAVRCMIFSEDGKYVLSSAIGEKYIAVWKIDGSKNQSASCVLLMEHPAVSLHSKCADNEGTDDVGLYVLAISELGLCYFWYGKNIEELRNTKPTRISLSSESHLSKNPKAALPMIFAAELQGILTPGSGQVFVTYGSIIKPSFEKILVQHGIDIKLKSNPDGILLPTGQSHTSQKGLSVQTGVIALDRTNAEDAFIPVPKLLDFHDKKRRQRHSSIDLEEVMTDDFNDSRSQTKPMDTEDDQEKHEEDPVTICMEDRLRSLGILSNEDNLGKESYPQIPNNLALGSTIFNDSHFEDTIPQKKIKEAIFSMTSRDAYKLLTILVAMWKSRSDSGKYVLPWICGILVKHSHYVISKEPSTQMLDSLFKMTESKCLAVQPLLQLSGRMQLILAQVDKAGQNKTQTSLNDDQFVDSECEDEDVDEFVYGEENDESQSGSDDDDN